MIQFLTQNRVGATLLAASAAVASATPVLVFLFATMGSLSGDHQVLVGYGKDGARVVLQHNRVDAEIVKHYHGCIAKVLVAFTNSNSNDEADHIIQVHSSNALQRFDAVRLSSTDDSPVPLPSYVAATKILPPAPVHVSSLCNRPPPGVDVGITALVRTTVLLI